MLAIIFWSIILLAVVNGVCWDKGKPKREAEAKRIRELPPLTTNEQKTVADAEAYFKNWSVTDGKPWRYKH
jgi:hypothetical protein